MPVYELLEGKGYEVKLAHPKETRIIAKAKVKTDKVDSERLAHLLRSNFCLHLTFPRRRLGS